MVCPACTFIPFCPLIRETRVAKRNKISDLNKTPWEKVPLYLFLLSTRRDAHRLAGRSPDSCRADAMLPAAALCVVYSSAPFWLFFPRHTQSGLARYGLSICGYTYCCYCYDWTVASKEKNWGTRPWRGKIPRNRLFVHIWYKALRTYWYWKKFLELILVM